MQELLNIIKYSKKLKLLYVEDNKEARESTLLVFNEFFDEIISAVDGLDALSKFDDSIDLIITDINMPKLNGLEMIKKIRKIKQNIPILVLSAHNETSFFIESIKLGVDGYLLKPIDMDQIILSFSKIIEKIKILDLSKKNINILNQYQEITDKNSLVLKLDLEGKFTYANNKFCELFEYTREELYGNSYTIFNHKKTSIQEQKNIWNEIQSKKTIWQGIVKKLSKSGKSYYLNMSIKPILDFDGNIIEFISINHDVTDIMSQEKRLNDLLESNKNAIIVLLKIEQFVDIKKYYGIDISNDIEKEFLNKIPDLIPKNFTYKRIFLLENGLFALFKENNLDKIPLNTLIKDINILRENINDTVLYIKDIDYDISIKVSLSYGVDAYENAKHGLSLLLETKQDFIFANDLLFQEKEAAEHNFKTLKIIKKAIENSNIIVYYQGIIDNKTDEIVKYEVLVRLINEQNEVLSPYHFLEVSKRGKYYYKITEIVLNHAFDCLKRTKKELTINLSAIDIEKKSIREKIFNLLENNKDDAHRIVFELLEDEEIKDFNLTKEFISKVKSFGVKIAIDDFGAGYSNFERLLDYKPDIIKIDGSLIKNIHKDSYSLSVVETIVEFAKKQDIKVVAEFVENENIYKIVNKLNIDYSQGYYFCKPEPENKIL